MSPGTSSPAQRRQEVIQSVLNSATVEGARLRKLRETLMLYKNLVDAKYVRLGEGYGDKPSIVIRFDGHRTDTPESRLSDIAGTAVHALLSAWIASEFDALVKQERALEDRDLLAEAAALLAAGEVSRG